MSERFEYSDDVIVPPDGYRIWRVSTYTRRGMHIGYEVFKSQRGEADIIEWPTGLWREARQRIEAHEATKAAKKTRGAKRRRG